MRLLCAKKLKVYINIKHYTISKKNKVWLFLTTDESAGIFNYK